MGLTIDDLNRDDETTVCYLRATLNGIEENLMAEHFPQALKQLDQLDATTLTASQDRMQYYYLRGMLATLTNQPGSAALFNFTKILEELDGVSDDLLTAGLPRLGVLYARQGSMDQADFFFAKVINYLQANANGKWAHTSKERYLRIISMMYYAAEYHALNHRLAISDRVLTETINICATNHVTYFMPRIKLLLANNAIAAGMSTDAVDQLLDEAMVFARFNRNSVVQVQVAAVRNNYHKEIKHRS
ncbi:MAG: XRE family transcriptional regulator [Limosilactobacillus pontis]